MKVYKFYLHAFYITLGAPSGTLNPLASSWAQASLDQLTDDLVDLGKESPLVKLLRFKGLVALTGNLYRPYRTGLTSFQTIRTELAQQSLDDHAAEVAPGLTIQEALCGGGNIPPRQPLIVVFGSAPVSSSSQGLKRQRAASTDEEDVTPFTKKFKEFEEYKSRVLNGPTPSQAAKSGGYIRIQASPGDALLDGRFNPQEPVDTTAPPIELYHVAFAQFSALLRDPVPEDEDVILRNTAALIRSRSEIERSKVPRNADICMLLELILGIPFVQLSNDDDYILSPHKTNFGVATAAVACVEVKKEMGSTGTDPSVQASFSFSRFYCQQQRDDLTAHSNCPTFIIGIAGPWLVIMGGVLTTRPIVQRLSDYLWLGNSRVMDEAQVKRVARTFYALRKATQTLKQHWKSFTRPSIVKGFDHPRFFPSFDRFIDEHTGNVVKFAYVKALEEAPSCVTFLVKKLLAVEAPSASEDEDEDDHPTVDKDSSSIVIKFIRRYNKEAHLIMGEKGYAPKLLGYRSLGEESPGYEDLTLLAMEYVEGQTLFDRYQNQKLPVHIKDGVKEALRVLNDAGYIFADLRRPNVMATSDEKVQLIDFDWVCEKDGGMRYPFHLSEDARKRSGAEDNEVITLKHQQKMLKEL
ncbi:hypothetical protein E1B28_008330 [Marasmius oreades]|uniref:Protein kinase domain-containing protein n=1 Tax=Marasmius oreades TaxID=181124 RepID=A0A9P7US08_9AGAR|nr:uncharacterized protein E1B28_008330 [Marasmius oreades]KAG7091938.1 hypothetical protein E1B28_008330 [Marasmius oreades]